MVSYKKYTAIDISNLIIIYANESSNRQTNLTQIKLQKILYYVYIECLVKHGVKLFETPIEKRKFGSVISSVYHNFKNYTVRHIDKPSSSYVFDEKNDGLYFEEIPFSPDNIELDLNIKEVIRKKVMELIDINPFELIERTYREMPWKNFKTQILKGEQGLTYSDDELIAYFSNEILD